MLDVIITGADLVDGTGARRRRTDVGIKDGRIVAIGALGQGAQHIIDATAKLVTRASSTSTLTSMPRCCGITTSRRRHSTG
jgi:urease alpha subunit